MDFNWENILILLSIWWVFTKMTPKEHPYDDN